MAARGWQPGWPWAAYALVLFGAPLVFDESLGLTLLAQVGMAIIACLSLNVLLGQCGLLSFGHAVYSGIGAFVGIHALNQMGVGRVLPVSLVPLLAGLGSAAVALALGWVSTRRPGTAFAMITFGLGELVWTGATMFPALFGGEAGVSANRVAGAAPWGISFGPQVQVVYLIACYTFVCTGLMYGFTRTPLGRMLNAVRDNAERVAFVGYDPHRVRWLAFVVAAFFAGIAGGLAALNFELVTADVFSAQRSGAYLLFTVLGGTRHFVGPILGAVLMVLSFSVLSGMTPAWLLYVGILFVVMMRLAPGGLAALLLNHDSWLVLWRGRGGWRRLGVWLGAGLALLGLVLLVEMTYHLQLRWALGSVLHLWGLQLDVLHPQAWLIAVLLLLGGGVALRLCRSGLASVTPMPSAQKLGWAIPADARREPL